MWPQVLFQLQLNLLILLLQCAAVDSNHQQQAKTEVAVTAIEVEGVEEMVVYVGVDQVRVGTLVVW